MNRKLRRNLDLVLTALGIAVIFSAVMLGQSFDLQAQMMIVLVGVICMEAGVWGMSRKFFSKDRRFSGLRSEGDHMLSLIRELNSAAIAKDIGTEDARRYQATLEEMHATVSRMAQMAGVEDSHESLGEELQAGAK